MLPSLTFALIIITSVFAFKATYCCSAYSTIYFFAFSLAIFYYYSKVNSFSFFYSGLTKASNFAIVKGFKITWRVENVTSMSMFTLSYLLSFSFIRVILITIRLLSIISND